MTPQTLTITIVFSTEHTPGTPGHLQEIARRYFAAKGVTLVANQITL